MLNQYQQNVVNHTKGPLVVLAGAGAGKTHTMTQKVAHLIKSGVMPSRIYGCTLTNKAADEIKKRVKKEIGSDGERVHLSTIHSMCYKILREGKQTRDPFFRMPKLITSDSIKIYTMLSQIWKYKFPYGLRDPKMFVERIAELQMNLIKPKEHAMMIEYDVVNKPVIDREGKLTTTDDHAVLNYMYTHYENWKAKTNQMDFNDILTGCFRMIHDPNYARYMERLSERVEYAIIDETQDTNTLCFKIFKRLVEHHKNVTIVGDLKQTIFSFQGASIDNITGFIKDYDAQIMDLPINYRSTKTIVENANFFMKDAAYNIGEPCSTPNEQGEPIRYFTSFNNHEEAHRIVEVINDLKSSGEEYKDMAILYRVHSQSFEIEAFLMGNDIPYVTYNQKILTDRAEIKPIIQYLALFKNPAKCSVKRFEALVKKPSRFVSNRLIADFIDLVEQYDEENNCIGCINSIGLGGVEIGENHNCTGLISFADQIMEGNEMYKDGAKPSQLIEYILNEIGYAKWADEIYNKKKDTQNDMAMNFDTLRSVSENCDTLDDFFDLIKEMKKRASGKGEFKDSVKLMTVHASKGKEFDNVIVAGCCSRIYPFYKALEEKGGAEEEKRIMYVAITRPAKRLYFSAITERYGRYKVMPSYFLNQMNFNYTGGSNV